MQIFATVLAIWEVPILTSWQAVLIVIHFIPRRGSTFTEGQCVVKDIYTVNNKKSKADYHSAPEKVLLYLGLYLTAELVCVPCFNDHLYGTCHWSRWRSRPHGDLTSRTIPFACSNDFNFHTLFSLLGILVPSLLCSVVFAHFFSVPFL